MDTVIFVLILVDLYCIVFFRMMIAYWLQRATGRGQSGLLAALSYPGRDGLPPEGLVYYRRYWCAVAVLIALVIGATALRLPALRTAFG